MKDQDIKKIAKQIAILLKPERCKYCHQTIDGHCGGQYWCYDNYHSKKPTKFTPLY